jgi:hypothetical protein
VSSPPVNRGALRRALPRVHAVSRVGAGKLHRTAWSSGSRRAARWHELFRLMSERPSSMVVSVVDSLSLLAAASALLAGTVLGMHLREYATLQCRLGAGIARTVFLFPLQVAYMPKAISWAVAFALWTWTRRGGSATVVTPTGWTLGRLPAPSMLAALRPGLHAVIPGLLASAWC